MHISIGVWKIRKYVKTSGSTSSLRKDSRYTGRRRQEYGYVPMGRAHVSGSPSARKVQELRRRVDDRLGREAGENRDDVTNQG